MPEHRFKFNKINRISVFEMLAGLDWNAVKTFLNNWKDGTGGYITIHKERKPKSPEQLGYYYAVILPHAVQAFKDNEDYSLLIEGKDKRAEIELTQKNMDFFLKTRYAAMEGIYMDKGEMSKAECAAFESFCIKWVAKWLDYQIPPANPNWKDDDE